MELLLKRVYEAADEEDGVRILVDRLWPRGVSKERAKLDLWLKEIAPSDELRRWFDHELEKWSEFRRRYRRELREREEELEQIRVALKRGRVTLLYGAKDAEHNQAVVLKEYLEG